MAELISISFALLMGLLMTRVFKYCHLNLPDVTAYLIAGVVIGPYCIGALDIPLIGFHSMSELDAVEVISSVALGFIAFSIGNEFRLSQLRETGKQATIIGIFQALTATLLVDITLLGFCVVVGKDTITPSVAITLGAIATATAPAATLMVVRQYKAKGKVTDLLLPIVALDDAVGLVVFAVSFGVAKALQIGKVDVLSIVVQPLLEIVLSLVLGAVTGWILTVLENLFYSNSNRLSMSIAFVFATVAISSLEKSIGKLSISFSSLLVCMMMGTIFCNLCERSEDIMKRCDQWTSPLFALFFVLSGAELELSVLSNPLVILVGILYILMRSVGKYYGARFSAKFTCCDLTTQKYLGITLLPQAGVALGMCVTATELGENDGVIIRNVVLFGVLIYEIFGPLATRWALEKAGDIAPISEENKTHDRHSAKK